MAGQDIVQQLINRLGQSQRERLPDALVSGYINIDERHTVDYYELLRRLSEMINFYQADDETIAGDWSSFFPFEKGEAATWLALNQHMPPHLALIQAFLKLYGHSQSSLNRITDRHLDFYYQQVLRLPRQAATPDKAHLLLELKKNAGSMEIKSGHLFSAGKDNTGIERVYRATQSTVINQSRIYSVSSLFVEPSSTGNVRYAPVANSVDGLGAELPEDNQKWYGFGHGESPLATTGFALSSPVLRMQEGIRRVTITLSLNNVSPTNIAQKNIDNVFNAYITGQSSWIGPITITPKLSGNVLVCEFEISSEQEAIIDYDQEIHGYNFSASAPIVQLLLNTDHSFVTYKQLSKVNLSTVSIKVNVSGMGTLNVENDNGSLNPEKAFMPFGSEPKPGSRLLLGCDEALNKKLSDISFDVDWKSPPANLANHYQHYGVNGLSNRYFTVNVKYQDASNQLVSRSGLNLFDSGDAREIKTIDVSSSQAVNRLKISQPLIALNLSRYSKNSYWARQKFGKMLLQNQVYKKVENKAAKPVSGFISIELNQSFLHETYRKQYVKNILQYHPWQEDEPVIINEPYTPEIKSIRLNYQAYTDRVNLESNTISAFSNEEVHFYHVGYSGQRRDHCYQRHLFDYVLDKTVTLLPSDFASGELLIGIEHASRGDSLSLLFQVAEGSADPLLPRQKITWSVLCDNYWKRLEQSQLLMDTTNHLLTSGLVRMLIPKEATTENTLLSSGYLWLKASVSGNPMALCQLRSINTNAIEVQFVDQNNDPDHLSAALPENTIAKSKQSLSTLKTIQQPYASFGGKRTEARGAFNTRVAERLRHKRRGLSQWDVERLVLEEFNQIYKAKCIPHGKPNEWLSPGHVTVVVVPDLTNQNAVNRLEPRVDAHTLVLIETLLQSIGNPQAVYHVINPRYQKIQLQCKVSFASGYEFNFYRHKLNDDVVQFLSPWAAGGNADIRFGGKIYKSVLLDFIEELPYVDFITDFSLYSYINDGDEYSDESEVITQSPDVILVSAADHVIEEVEL